MQKKLTVIVKSINLINSSGDASSTYYCKVNGWRWIDRDTISQGI